MAAARKPWPVQLQTTVVDLARNFDGEFGVYVKHLRTGVKYTYNSATPFYLASVVKFPIMVTIFDGLNRGEWALAEPLEFSESDRRDGSAVLGNAAAGQKYSMMELLDMMMNYSDNSATDLLVKRMGTEAINNTLRKLELHDFREITGMLDVRRRIYGLVDAEAEKLSPEQIREIAEDKSLRKKGQALAKVLGKKPAYSSEQMQEAFDTYYATEVNSAPLDAIGELLERLGTGQLISPQASSAMLEIMKACKTGVHRVRAGLPDTTVFAHKTGTQHQRICDVGIFYLRDDDPVIAAICVKEFSSQSNAEKIMAKIGSELYSLLEKANRQDMASREVTSQP